MKLNKILLSAAVAMGCLTASAQEEVTEYFFQPHWYLQGQFGGQETLGEGAFGKLASPNAQVAVGYKFNPYIGARLVVNGWQSRAVSKIDGATYKWKWNYVAPTVNVVFDMTNILGGYNPTRLVDVNVFGGVGANVGFNNDEANTVCTNFAKNNDGINMMGLLWSGTKTRFVGQFGADVNFNVSKHVAIGLELQANVLPDSYNSKKAGNADWYFNALVGVRYTFGDKFVKKTRKVEQHVCEPQIVEKIVEKIVEVPVEVPVTNKVVEKAQEPYRTDIFFTISNTTISKTEMTKVEEMANYLKSHPDAKVVITGYADKGTGTRAINLRLSNQRAQTVAKTLRTKFGIAESRITVKSMGEAEDQPYSEPVKNRVAICIAQD